MRSLSVDELCDANPRLRRRLGHANWSQADLALLIRSTLIELNGQANLTGSTLAGQPSNLWAGTGLIAKDDRLTVEPWLPSWLDHYGAAPDAEPSRKAKRQIEVPARADAFYTSACSGDSYRTAGQRDAVRALAIAGPGDTVVCVLPTGSGKTNVPLTRALRQRPSQSLIIVPTIALAVDLEARIQGIIGETLALAYHSGLPPEAQHAMRAAIHGGTQWLTIASPEAACASLAKPLVEAATQGRLDLIIIDEAHIVAQWGDEFRPHFQLFSGLRQRLIDVSPPDRAPVTVLLTGTLDEYGWSALRRLFPGRQFQLVTAQATRPEPAWWSARCVDEQQKRDRLIEAMRRMPRPAIVFTSLHSSERSTTTRTVKSWLDEAGFRATAVVDGRTPPQARAAAASGLRLLGPPGSDVDIVVATSAFGLGIDVRDIRTILHVCLPESVDRLYQEVGRAGRDGNAATSLVLWTDRDLEVATSMSQARQIGSSKAWRRWRSMTTGAWDGNVLDVDLRAHHDEVKYPWSEANRYWNMQMLLTMGRAKMIKIRWPDVSELPDTEDELQVFLDGQRARARVEVIQSDLGDEAIFRRRFEAGRQAARVASSAGLASAAEIVGGLSECTNQYLARHYRLSDEHNNRFQVDVHCGGCPQCRAAGRIVTPARRETGPAMSGTLSRQSDPLLGQLAIGGRLGVRTADGDLNMVRHLTTRLAKHGVVAFIGPAVGRWLPAASAGGIWWTETIEQWLSRPPHAWRVPTILLLEQHIGEDVAERAVARLTLQTVGVLIAHSDQHDFTDAKRSLHDVWTPSYFIEDLLRRI